MTERKGNVVVIEEQAPEPCSRCGHLRECRPLKEDGLPVCFGCSTKAEREAYGKRLFGVVDN